MVNTPFSMDIVAQIAKMIDHSLLHPTLDDEALKAVTIQDIFDYLSLGNLLQRL